MRCKVLSRWFTSEIQDQFVGAVGSCRCCDRRLTVTRVHIDARVGMEIIENGVGITGKTEGQIKAS